VVLQGTDPPVWRQLLVRSHATLGDLHLVLQRAMGWQGAHLHAFRVGPTTNAPARLGDYGPRHKDESRARLAALAPAGTRVVYEYDFGDGWEHLIDVQKVMLAAEGEVYPRCVAGARACPPEDCGGAWGYAELLQTLESGGGEQRDEVIDWLGGEFDPGHFDLAIVNAALTAGGTRPRHMRLGGSAAS